MHGKTEIGLFDASIARAALGSAAGKLDPRVLFHNPVMFVTEVVAALSTLLFLRGLFVGTPNLAVVGQIAAWLWFTVYFANFAEAMAEGRGKARADALRATQAETPAKRLLRDRADDFELVSSHGLVVGDVVLVETGDLIPADGEVIEGVASVDESAITGESAPVIREAGGDRSGVTGGTRVVSDWLKVRVTARAGESFLDRMISLVEGAERQKTPNEIALTILLVGMTIIFLIVVVTLEPFVVYSGAFVPVVFLVALLVTLIPTTIGGLLSAIGIAGMDRLVKANVIAKSGPRGRGRRRCRYAAPRQDRHDHLRQPHGRRLRAAARHRPADAGLGRTARLPLRRDAGGQVDRRSRRQAGYSGRRGGCRLHPVLRPDPHVRRQPRRRVAAP